jgi:hypothetical protein
MMLSSRLTFVLGVVAIATLLLAGSASADPPIQDFYFKWGPADEALWFSAGGEDFCPVQTGKAWHSECGVWPFYVADSTHPFISGYFVWEVDHLNGFYWPEWYGFWPQPQIHGTWRIQPTGIDGYWAGTFQTVDNWEGEYNAPIARMVGRGYGAFDGYLIKGTHWFEPAASGTSPYGDFWPVMSGELLLTGTAR